MEIWGSWGGPGPCPTPLPPPLPYKILDDRLRTGLHLIKSQAILAKFGWANIGSSTITELASSVSRKREGQVILQLRQAKRDSCKAWEDYWLKQGMAKEWVAY